MQLVHTALQSYRHSLLKSRIVHPCIPSPLSDTCTHTSCLSARNVSPSLLPRGRWRCSSLVRAAHSVGTCKLIRHANRDGLRNSCLAGSALGVVTKAGLHNFAGVVQVRSRMEVLACVFAAFPREHRVITSYCGLVPCARSHAFGLLLVPASALA